MILWIISFIGLGVVVFLAIYYWLAPRNRWFTFVKEGTAKVIVRGDAVRKILIQWEGYTFNYKAQGFEDKWQVVKGKESHLFGGLRLYSLLHPLDDIFIYRQEWSHLHPDGKIKHHNEMLDYVFLKEDLYVIEIPLVEKEGAEEGVEDINGVPMGIKIVVPMKIVNPYVAIFRVRRWLPQISGIILGRLRRFVANYRYKEDLLNMRAALGITEIQREAGIPEAECDLPGRDLWEKFWFELERDFETKGAEITGDGKIIIYGVEINTKGAQILEIAPSSGYKKYTTMKYEAEKEREKTLIAADAERQRLEIVAQGEKAKIEAIYSEVEKFGDLGRLVRALEAMEKSRLAASLVVQAVPGLQEVLRGVFGKGPEEVSPQEFRELKTLIEELLKVKEKEKGE